MSSYSFQVDRVTLRPHLKLILKVASKFLLIILSTCQCFFPRTQLTSRGIKILILLEHTVLARQTFSADL